MKNPKMAKEGTKVLMATLRQGIIPKAKIKRQKAKRRTGNVSSAKESNALALRRDSLLIFVAGVALFTVWLPPEFIGLDGRFALFAQEMLRNGPTFFPTSYGQPYPDYPATGTFLIYLASLPMGRVTPFTAALPTAIASALILVLIYRIGATHSRHWGLMGVGFAMLTKTFVSMSRCVSLDQFVCLATGLGFYLIYTADIYGKKGRLWLVPAIMAGSFAFRGPIGVVVPAAVVCAYYLMNRDLKRLLAMGVAAAVVLTACMAGLMAAAKSQGGEAFVKDVITMQAAGRMYEESHGFAYYFTDGVGKYAMCYPVAIMAIALCGRRIWRRDGQEYRLLGLLAAWAIVVIVGMSMASTKKARYLLPAVPALALVAGWLMCEAQREGLAANIKAVLLWIFKALPVGACLYAAMAWATAGRWDYVNPAGQYAAAALMTGVLAAISWAAYRRFNGEAMEWAAVGAAALTLVILVASVSEPIACARERSGPFTARVAAMCEQRTGQIVFYKITRDKEAIKFMVNYGKPLEPVFITEPAEISGCASGSYIIAKAEAVSGLPEEAKEKLTMVYSGRFDSEDCVVAVRK
jgi:4-amino-4-deoxy-L-arabinose transferase-like glycosyltransferase